MLQGKTTKKTVKFTEKRFLENPNLFLYFFLIQGVIIVKTWNSNVILAIARCDAIFKYFYSF